MLRRKSRIKSYDLPDDRDFRPIGTVVSFPKSGRTWLRVMLDQLGLELNYSHDGSSLKDALHFGALKPASQKYPGSRLLFLYRDPLDTVVSAYFQNRYRSKSSFQGSISDFVQDPSRGIEKVVTFNLTWLEQGSRASASFGTMSYEDLHGDTAGVMVRLLNFLCPERCFDDELIDRVVTDCSFEKLQERERLGEFSERYGRRLRPVSATNPESYKVRRGKVGGFVDYLDRESIQFCEDVMRSHHYLERVSAIDQTVRI